MCEAFQTDLSSKQCTLDPWLYGAFQPGLAVALIWYQICEDPMMLKFSSKILTKSKSSQTLHSSRVRWETWRLWLQRDSYSYRWETLHTWSWHTGGSPKHVWGHIWDFWDFCPIAHYSAERWRTALEKSSWAVPSWWPKCPGPHLLPIWSSHKGPGHVPARSETFEKKNFHCNNSGCLLQILTKSHQQKWTRLSFWDGSDQRIEHLRPMVIWSFSPSFISEKPLTKFEQDLSHLRKKISVATILDALSEFWLSPTNKSGQETILRWLWPENGAL